jgi:hypothetical protein
MGEYFGLTDFWATLYIKAATILIGQIFDAIILKTKIKF